MSIQCQMIELKVQMTRPSVIARLTQSAEAISVSIEIATPRQVGARNDEKGKKSQ